MAHSAQTDMINKKYFILNYPLANSLVILAVLFHIWSGGSEFLGIQGYVSDFIRGKFPDLPLAVWASAVVPLLLSVTIEFSFVALLRYLLNSLLYKTLWRENIAKAIQITHNLALERYRAEKDKFDADPDEYGLQQPAEPEMPDIGMIQIANFAMFVMAAIAFVAVFGVSMTVSKKSIEYDTLVNGPQAKIYSIDSLDEIESQRKSKIYTLVDGELYTVRSAFQRDSLAIEAEYAGRIGSKAEKLNEYTIREQQTDQRYTRSKSIRKQEIQNLEARKAQDLKGRSALLAENEAEIRSRYAPQLLALSKDFTARRAELQQDNQYKKEVNAERNAWFSSFLRSYAQLATVGQFMCWVYVILAFYVMGIQKKPRVRPESLESGLLSDLVLLLYTAPTRMIHNQIRGLLSKVPPLYQMPGIGAVYDLDTLNEIAPLLERLDKTKSLEEKRKLQRTINRKISGYQHTIAESVENEGVETERRNSDVGNEFSTRSQGPVSTHGSTRGQGVETDVEKRRKDLEPESVETLVDSVATRSTPQGRGVESALKTGVENPAATRRKADREGVETGRRNGVETTVLQGVERLETTRVETTGQPTIFAVDIKEQVVLKAQYEGEVQEEKLQIRVVIDGIMVKGYYHDDYHPHAFFKKMKQNYEGYYRRKQRNMLTNLLRIELAEKYMELIERVGAKHNLTVKPGVEE